MPGDSSALACYERLELLKDALDEVGTVGLCSARCFARDE